MSPKGPRLVLVLAGSSVAGTAALSTAALVLGELSPPQMPTSTNASFLKSLKGVVLIVGPCILSQLLTKLMYIHTCYSTVNILPDPYDVTESRI